MLRKFHQADYPCITAILADNPTLYQDLALQKVPHFTTLQKAERKLLDERSHRNMLDQTLAICFDLNDKDEDGLAPREAQLVDQAAADSTGFDLDHASRYFTHRKRKPRKNKGETQPQPVIYRRFAKLGIVVCCATHLILSTHRGVGPRPDTDELRPLMNQMARNVILEQMLADAGYDSEPNHVLLRDKFSIDSVIPATHGRPTDKYRYLMQTDFNEEDYGQRWQSETVMFMLKHHQGASLTARKSDTQHRELGLMALVHNIMI